MKLYRNAIILLVFVGLLLGTYFYVTKKVEDKTDITETPTETTENKSIDNIVSLDINKIIGIAIDNNVKKFEFEKKSDKWTVITPADLKLDESKVFNLSQSFANLKPDKIMEEDAKDLKIYGLDKPKTITVKVSDSPDTIIEIGDMTSTKDGYYVMLKNTTKVYKMPKSSIESFFLEEKDLKDKKLFDFNLEDINVFSLKRAGELIFTAKGNGSNWSIVAPIECDVDNEKLSAILGEIIFAKAAEIVEENAKDLDKYGLKDPRYAIEIDTSKGKKNLLLGIEKEKGSTIFCTLEGTNTVYLLEMSVLTFIDVPLKEVVNVFPHIQMIDDVSRIIVEFDGKKIDVGVQNDPENKGNDKFTIDGKDANVKDSDGNFIFRKFYQGIVGVTMTDIEVGAVPTGKAEIAFTYTLKTEPSTMKVEFIPKNDKQYYVVKNGRYNGMVVDKSKFDAEDGLRASYKKLIDAMNAQ